MPGFYPIEIMKTAPYMQAFILICLLNSIALADMKGSGYRILAGGQEFQVEIAESSEQKRLGLMHRRAMPALHGLLMVFERDKTIPIWMKEMQFPLDVVWISAAGIVVDLQTLQPCRQNPCPVFNPRQPARFVLEVGAGLFPLNRGDKVEIIDASGDSLLPSV